MPQQIEVKLLMGLEFATPTIPLSVFSVSRRRGVGTRDTQRPAFSGRARHKHADDLIEAK